MYFKLFSRQMSATIDVNQVDAHLWCVNNASFLRLFSKYRMRQAISKAFITVVSDAWQNSFIAHGLAGQVDARMFRTGVSRFRLASFSLFLTAGRICIYVPP
jgi:hypothetical protein